MESEVREQSQWLRAIQCPLLEQPDPNSWSENEEAVCEWYRGATDQQCKDMIFDHIVKGIRISQSLERPSQVGIFNFFLQMYYSPHFFELEGVNDQKPTFLNFRQFSVLSDFMNNDEFDSYTPMVRAPPEYWYLYTAASCSELVYRSCESFETELVVGTPRYSIGSLKTKYGSEIYAVDGTKLAVGSPRMPRFSLPNGSYRISLPLYEAWPLYWESFEKRAVSNFIGRCTVEAVRYVVKAKKNIVLPFREKRYSPIPQPIITLRMSKDQTYLDEIEAEIVEHTTDFLDEMSPLVYDSANSLPQVLCVCPQCKGNAVDAPLEFVGAVKYCDLLTEIPIPRPILEEESDGCDNYYENVELDDFAVESSLLSAVKDPVWEVAIDKALWEAYLKVDGVVAKYASNNFYDQLLESVPAMTNDFGNSHFAKHGGKGVPRTYNKFAWLYAVLGLVRLGSGESYPVGKEMGFGEITALEFSGAPWGNMMALLEAGLVSKFYYTVFKGESFAYPVYKAMEGKTEEILKDVKISTDIKSLAQFFFANKFRNRSNPDKDRHAILVFDIPLHRNSSMARSGKDHSLDQKQRKEQEFVDDVPLGRKDAMVSYIRYYNVLTEIFLQKGGMLIVKVMEFWHREIIDALYFLFKGYREVSIFLNPYSRPASKEVYFVGVCKQDAHGPILNEGVFRSKCVKFANYVLYKLTCNLIKISQKHGERYLTERIVNCRQHLTRISCFKGLAMVKENVSRLVLPRLYGKVHVCTPEWYDRYLSENYGACEALTRRIGLSHLRAIEVKKDERIGEAEVKLLMQQTNCEALTARAALDHCKGDIVDAIMWIRELMESKNADFERRFALIRTGTYRFVGMKK